MSGNKGKARISAQDWETLYRQYLPKLRGYFASSGFDPAETEDLAHDVFQELGRGKTPEDPRAYIYAIARHILAQRRRRDIAERTALGKYARPGTSDDAHSAPDPLDGGPAAEALSVEVEEILRTVLAKLSPKDAQLLTIRFIQGLSARQVAQRVNCSENAVRKRTRKLKAVMRRFFRE